MLNRTQVTEAVESGQSRRPRRGRRPRLSPQKEETTIESNASDDAFVAIIKRQDSIPDVSRVGGDRIHASSLLDRDFCPRKEWLMRTSEQTCSNYAGGAMRLVWALGRAAEHHARQQLLKELRHAAIGSWFCRCGRTTQTGKFDSDATCPYCETHLDNYGEAVLEVGSVIGSPDFLVEDEDGRIVVLEFKSIKADHFKALTGPHCEHALQANTYVYMLHRMGLPVNPTARVIYLAKDYMVGESVYKEYPLPIPFNFDAPPGAIRLGFEDAELAMGEEMPDQIQVCSTGGPTCTKAKNCPCVARCFALNTEVVA